MTHKIDTNWKYCLYALISQTNPEILAEIKIRATKEVQVAAQLVKTNNIRPPNIILVNNEGTGHQFYLDTLSKTMRSKGNWMWVKQLQVYYPTELLLDIQLMPRVIDIPYASGNYVCGHSLFKHLRADIITHLQSVYNHA
jgi:hypothetical protein